ncbi:MAG: DUF4097 family beta strand repeat protein [Deltaproteobacteria bacterium]|nr:DUF4097 family beta strand repeat protein [Deltaproteobacteria bacterium]
MNFVLNHQSLELEISLIKGGLEIIEMERADVELSFSELRKNTADELFSISFQDGLLFVKERTWKKTSMSPTFFRNETNNDLVLKIPIGTQLRGSIATVSGDIRAALLSGSLKIKTISGQMDFGRIESDRLRLQNIGGNLKIDTLVGAINAKVISGKCLIKNGRISRFAIGSVSGDITIDADFDLDRESTIHTVSGDTSLNIRSYTGDHGIYISTLSGETAIKGDYPKEKVEIKKRMPFLKNHPFKTVMPAMKNFVSSFAKMADDDGIEINTAADSENIDPHIQQILQMLSDGKINAEEAEKLISALK